MKKAAVYGKERLMDLTIKSMDVDDKVFNATSQEKRRITLQELNLPKDYEFVTAAGEDKLKKGKCQEITLSEKMAMIAKEYDGLAKKGAFFEALKEEFPERYGKTYINKTPENLRETVSENVSENTNSSKNNIILKNIQDVKSIG